MWDKQDGVPESSRAPLSIKLEEDGSKFEYIQPRQNEYHIIQAD